MSITVQKMLVMWRVNVAFLGKVCVLLLSGEILIKGSLGASGVFPKGFIANVGGLNIS